MMQFSNPMALWLLLLLPVLMRRRIVTAWAKAADLKLIESNLIASSAVKLWPFMFFYAVSVMALANPVIKTGIPLPYEGQDNAVIAMQLGQCLQANKAAAYQASMEYDNAALVAYDDKAYIISPMSPDKSIFRHFLKELAPDMRVGQGDISVRALKKFAAKRVAVVVGDLIVFNCGQPAVYKTPAVASVKNIGPYLAVFLALFFLARMPFGGISAVVLFISLLSANGYASWWRNEKQNISQIIADGASYYAVGDYAAAAQIWQRGGGMCADCMYNHGNAMAFMGDIDAAIQSYQQALRVDPGHDDARFNLEYLLRAQSGEGGANVSSLKKLSDLNDGKADNGDVSRIPAADNDETWLQRIQSDHGELLRGRIMRQRDGR